jgi:hypothetical protein
MAKVQVMQEPKGTITSEAPSIGLDPKAQGLGGAILADTGKQILDLGESMDKLRDHAETTKAESEGIKAMEDIHIKAMSSSDTFNAPEKVQEQLDNLKDTLASKITSPEARNKFSEKFDIESSRKYASILNGLRTKQTQVDRASVYEFAHNKTSEYAVSDNNDERNLIKQQIVDKVNSAVDIGSMKADAAQKYIVATFGKMATEQVEHDLDLIRTSDNPKPMYDTVKSEIAKGKDGMYADLSERQRSHFLDKTEKVFAKAEAVKTEVQNNRQNIRADSLASKISSGELTMMKLNEARANNHITSEDYKTFYNNLLAKTTAGTDHEAMTKLESDILGQMKQGELTKDRGMDWPATRRAIIQANTDGKISTNDMDKLLEYHLLPKQDMMKKLEDDTNPPANDTEFLKQQNEKKGAVTRRQSLIDSVMNMFKNHTNDNKRETGHLLVDHMNEVKDSKVTDEGFVAAAHKVISEDVAKRFPDILSYPKTGKVKFDGKGYYLFFPDKTYTQISEEEAIKHMKLEK